MTVLTLIAEILGFTVLGAIALLAIITAAVTIHDAVRARFPRYDDVKRWNRRRRRRGPT